MAQLPRTHCSGLIKLHMRFPHDPATALSHLPRRNEKFCLLQHLREANYFEKESRSRLKFTVMIGEES